jgi:hypothetical protein
MGLGLVHAGQAERGIETAGFGRLGEDFRHLFEMVLLPEWDNNTHRWNPLCRWNRTGMGRSPWH